jgi:hypothetical protein
MSIFVNIVIILLNMIMMDQSPYRATLLPKKNPVPKKATFAFWELGTELA